MSLFKNFHGSSKDRHINLGSNTGASSPDSVIARARVERQTRERLRKEEVAARRIQKVWRGRKDAQCTKDQLLVDLQSGKYQREQAARALTVVLWKGIGDEKDLRNLRAFSAWASQSCSTSSGSPLPLLEPLSRDKTYLSSLSILSTRALQFVARNSSSNEILPILALLENLLDCEQYTFLGTDQADVLEFLVVKLVQHGWVENLGPSKKKSAATPIIMRLLPRPLSLFPDHDIVESAVLPPFINTLLAIPQLPSSLPIPSLTHLTKSLPIISKLLPYAAANPAVLMQNSLATEMGKTHLLANLGFMVVQTGIIQQQDTKSVVAWVNVLTRLLEGVDDQWGLWLENKGVWGRSVSAAVQTAAIVESMEGNDLDIERDNRITNRKRNIQDRGSAPPGIVNRVLSIVGPDHLNFLTTTYIRQPAMTQPYIRYMLALLTKFRGSVRFDGIMEVLGGQSGTRLVRDLWRNQVRGKWPSAASKQAWDRLFSPTAGDAATASDTIRLQSLLLLTHIYIHHLLTVTDEEFFAPPSRDAAALSLDEVTELSGIWRDVAFWGYWSGLGNGLSPEIAKQKEEIRGLMTKGVLAITARDARRRFTPPDFWHMTSMFDLPSFIDAVCIEEQQLEQQDEDAMDDEDENGDSQRLPPALIQRRRQISKRQMALISPRLGLLNNLPMTIPFAARVEIFNDNDREKLGIDRYMRRRHMNHQATIRRGHISEDGFSELYNLGPLMKGTIQIRFIDEWGQEEAGIDGGGLFKEFLTSLSKEAFDTDRGLWLSTSQNELYPNPHSYAKETHQLHWYTFIGRVLGKALYEGVLVDVAFAGFFLAKWLGRQSYLDDLASLDPELYKGLVQLKNYAGNPEDLSLNFTVAEEEFGVTRSIDLVTGGSDIAVTRLNRMEYIQLVCDYKLNRQIAPQCEAFFSGLSDIIDPKWLRMYDQMELQTLIGGTLSPIDVDDLERNCAMPDGTDDDTIRLFWKVVRSFNQTELKALLKFVTSTPNPPLLGFKFLNPNFGIRLAGNDTTRLPSASACANLLKLPRYQDERTLRIKLLQAINSNAGFDLS
ncbi:hypothetical protein QFC22_001783 [Naganishia vaughanmartiniae]|uniref:Uncharacterized protein n=1 Tax=Naganishia vaughanmartiniae TaxID=1424756 RepID=A0ACC2XFE5_9TREE|nr:hypothetical protein QFC22_001783 [Naganishia vaughanmartiniae]